MDIDLEDSPSSPGLSSSTSTHPSSITVPAYYDEFNEFTQTANAAMKLAYPVHRRPRNPRVGVLLLSFAEDDLGVASEIGPLQDVFKNNYRYETEVWEIPSKSPLSALSQKLHEFREEYCDDNHEANDQLPLLIVYYGGHAAEPPRGQNICLWSGKADGPCAQLNWTTLQPIIFDAPADVLLILDCCFASSATWRAGTSHLGSKETISACGPSSFASAVGGRSFTTALTDQLRFQAGVATLLTGAALAGYLLDSDFRLQFQPAYARSHRTERNSVALIPFPPPNAVGTGELVTSPPLNRPPRSMARVLLAVHVKGDPNDELVSLLRNMNNLAGFLRNEHALPTSVVGVNIEGVEKVVHPEAAFKSTSTLILVSVPFAAWHLLPDHGACQFVSLISGPNLLSKRPEYTAGDSEAISADNEAIAAQSFLQDSGYGNMIGDYALERFGEFMSDDKDPISVQTFQEDARYIFSEGGTALDIAPPPPPYTEEPIFHDLPELRES